MPRCGLIRLIWGGGGRDSAGVEAGAAYARMLTSRVTIWSLIAGCLFRIVAGIGGGRVS